MIKKITLFTIFTILIWALAIGQTSKSKASNSSGSAATSPTLEQKITELKERIASRVAQLKLVEKRGVIGTVKDVSDTQIALSDLNGNTRFIDVDELTRFSSPSGKPSFGISDIKKGDTLGVLGLYNKESQRILARFVDELTLPAILHGAVSNIDNKKYSLTLNTEDGKQIEADVETITRTYSYSKNSGLIRSGFSKIRPNEHIIVVGFPDRKNENLLISERIILFPDIPSDPNLPQPALSPQEKIIPSTGSGKKLTPIVK